MASLRTSVYTGPQVSASACIAEFPKASLLQATHTLSLLNRHINVQKEGWNRWENNSQYSSRCRIVTRHLGIAWQLLCRLPGPTPDLLIPDLQVEGRGALVFHEPSSWFCCMPKFERQGPRWPRFLALWKVTYFYQMIWKSIPEV